MTYMATPNIRTPALHGGHEMLIDTSLVIITLNLVCLGVEKKVFSQIFQRKISANRLACWSVWLAGGRSTIRLGWIHHTPNTYLTSDNSYCRRYKLFYDTDFHRQVVTKITLAVFIYSPNPDLIVLVKEQDLCRSAILDFRLLMKMLLMLHRPFKKLCHLLFIKFWILCLFSWFSV